MTKIQKKGQKSLRVGVLKKSTISETPHRLERLILKLQEDHRNLLAIATRLAQLAPGAFEKVIAEFESTKNDASCH